MTNDIFTKEDQEFLIRNEALSDSGRIRAIETGTFPLSSRTPLSPFFHKLTSFERTAFLAQQVDVLMLLFGMLALIVLPKKVY